jgi:hypothetical protein
LSPDKIVALLPDPEGVQLAGMLAVGGAPRADEDFAVRNGRHTELDPVANPVGGMTRLIAGPEKLQSLGVERIENSR